MTLREKKKFIRNLMESVFKEMREKAALMPEEWDGIEIRWLLAEKFERETLNVRHDRIRQARKRAYNNEVITRNL